MESGFSIGGDSDACLKKPSISLSDIEGMYDQNKFESNNEIVN